MVFMPGYQEFTFNAEGYEKSVFRKGRGPRILLMHELPGMVEECVQLGDYIASCGFTVFLPLLFGEPNLSFSKVRTPSMRFRFAYDARSSRSPQPRIARSQIGCVRSLAISAGDVPTAAGLA